MKRLIIVMAIAALLAACNSSEDGGGQTDQAAQGAVDDHAGHDHAAPSAGQGEPTQMIPDDSMTEFEKAAEAKIRPYFDEAGTKTELTVEPGEYFDLFVFGEFNTLYPMSAAEYKLILPPGVSVMGTVATDSVIISMGKWDTDFMIAFHCAPGPNLQMMKYNCKAHEDFKGGEVTTQKGDNLSFIGFTLCDATKTLIRADGGTATIKKK